MEKDNLVYYDGFTQTYSATLKDMSSDELAEVAAFLEKRFGAKFRSPRGR